MKKLSLTTLFLIFVSVFTLLNAQTAKIDSLENLLQEHKSLDTVRVSLLNEIASNYLNTMNIEEAQKYAKEAQELAKELKFLRGEFNSLFLISEYFKLNNNNKAFAYYEKLFKRKL